jgi:peptidoglycan/LPS O-acetylase OafA/YrhL
LLTIGSLALASVAARTALFPDVSNAYLGGTLLGTFGWFAAGMLFAAVEQSPGHSLDRWRQRLASPALCWPLAALLFLVWVSSDVPEPFERHTLAVLGETTLVAVVAGLLLAPAVFGDSRRAVRVPLRNRVMVYLGTISYGIYLYHWPFAEWLSHRQTITRLGGTPYILAELVIVLGVVIALASLSWFLVEKPLMSRVKSIKALKSPASPLSEARPASEDRQATALAEPAP